MKHTAQIFAVTAVLVGLAFVPVFLSAQRSPQIAFYSEEPWGGSYLGVDTQDVTADRLSTLHLKEETGVEVTMVDQDAPAGKAGIKEHDVILNINDQKVESMEQLRRMIREVPPGRVISIGISRDGQPMTLKAQLAQRNKMPNMDSSFNFNPAINIPAIHIPAINMPEIDVPSIVVLHSPRSSGITIENLTPQLGEFFGTKGGRGVLIRGVEKGSRAETAGLRAGDVIVKINGSPVNDCSDFSRLLRTRTGDKASVTVLRDRKEQTMTLTFPEPKRSGSVSEKECEALGEETCLAMSQPEIAKADMARLRAEAERLSKQHRHQTVEQREELKHEMEKMHQDFGRQQREIEQERNSWKRDAEI